MAHGSDSPPPEASQQQSDHPSLPLAPHAQDPPEREHSVPQEQEQPILHPYGNTSTARSRNAPPAQKGTSEGRLAESIER